ncbi:MAG: hypothetical protein HPY52_06580 [Firmicutes bacterium]|nr:hypothetical protein [Bacillota bacterium]
MACFWAHNVVGLTWARAAITNTLSGEVIPLAFFPTCFRRIVFALPFCNIVHVPVSIYLG